MIFVLSDSTSKCVQSKLNLDDLYPYILDSSILKYFLPTSMFEKQEDIINLLEYTVVFTKIIKFS